MKKERERERKEKERERKGKRRKVCLNVMVIQERDQESSQVKMFLINSD